ncbi:unnamed protein product [Durusdinium trenchii]|uniref:Calpain catalytic domain-containing protein n=1 Tax=Durusdinium trenchii TaxID=1381693 RepID=A0ABP0PDI6_9DINO
MRLKGMDANWGYWGQDASAFCENKVSWSDSELWAKMKEYDKDGYSIACGSRGNYQGILAGHAYTILRFLDVEVTRNGKKETLLLMHVRNPHATNEWKGKWRDDDKEMLGERHEALKATGHKIRVKDNGVFWMDFEDFKHGFSEIAVCFDKRDPGRRCELSGDMWKHYEECDVLLLVLSKYTEPISLSDFRAVMLATLRSLAPKDWDTEHEVAWNWLWENIERVLKGQLGKPKALERALTHFIASWSEDQAMFFRKELYKRFFAFSPSGQDFFKQSSTYFLADRVVEMTVEMFREPRKMVQEISGLGLRHVGWGIPPELFGPYTSGAVESVRCMTTDENTQAAFRFSLSLIAKILVRAVTEGGTLVMRAINTNQELALKKAIAIAPRGKRAMELLNISVGTQSISPLFWSIESGSLNSARAMIVDLLTIRADRDVYYYGCDAMFTRHPDLILRLCNDASTLLWTLFDGLVWRSRLVQDGQRRVNYYIKHLVQDLEGNLSPALKWLAHHKDPRLVSHGVVMTFADLLWNRVASYQFLLGRGYFLFTLLIFITSQSLLVPGEEALWRNITTFVCRCFLYLGSMSKLLFDQCKLSCSAFKAGEYQWYWLLPVPNYLHSTQQAGSLLLVLLLILMYIQEPILWCISFGTPDEEGMIFTTTCPEAQGVMTAYTVFSCKPAAETAETIRAAPERGNVAEEAPEAPDCDGNVAELELEPVGILQRSRTLEVDREIMRGITMRKTLRHAWVWWQSPLDLEPSQREGLWKKSTPVSGFDIFLSHTWLTLGLSKFLAILLQTAWKWAMMAWFLTMTLLILLYVESLIPMSSRYVLPSEIQPDVTLPRGLWMTVASLPSLLLGLVLAVYIPEWVSSSPTCFLDAVSINQADQALMQQGVYGLGGFLKASKELRILWSSPYFLRLWCVFELAAYRTANPGGKVTLAPLFVEMAVAVYLIGYYLTCLVFVIDLEAYLAVSLLSQLALSFLLVCFLRRSLVAKRKLFRDLDTFDVDLAQCRLQYDRDFVFNAITEWFGSKEAFTEYVRAHLGEAAMSAFSASTIPLQYHILLVTSEVSLNLDNFMALWKGGMPSEVLCSHFLALVLGYAVCWRIVYLSLAVYLCDLVSHHCGRKCAMIMFDFLIFLTVNLCLVGGLFLARAAYGQGTLAASAWLAFAGLLALISQLPRRRSPRS